jgi:hypothetical protein
MSKKEYCHFCGKYVCKPCGEKFKKTRAFVGEQALSLNVS